MIAIRGGLFLMGSDDYYPDEAPSRPVRVAPFQIDAGPVTNRAFAAFVADTGYVTFAERPPDPADYAGILPEMIRKGSLVFRPLAAQPPVLDHSQWWDYVFDADWRHPAGPGSDLDGMEDHPVVHIALCDAEAYARWAGKALPSEAEWECAARGGLEGAAFAWGSALAPGGRAMANYWQGIFPSHNARTRGPVFTTPVGRYPPNGFGLYDMIGNVWEWTADRYDREERAGQPCCGSAKPHRDAAAIPRQVLKGGSHLCAPNYCQRYRPAARYPQPIDTSTSHVGFRCVRRQASSICDDARSA